MPVNSLQKVRFIHLMLGILTTLFLEELFLKFRKTLTNIFFRVLHTSRSFFHTKKTSIVKINVRRTNGLLVAPTGRQEIPNGEYSKYAFQINFAVLQLTREISKFQAATNQQHNLNCWARCSFDI